MEKPINTSDKDHSYFLSLELENLHCFKDKQFLDLSDGNNNYVPWTIILGDNGTGKTTLLRVLDRMQPYVEIKNGKVIKSRPLFSFFDTFFKTNNTKINLKVFYNELFKKLKQNHALIISYYYNNEDVLPSKKRELIFDINSFVLSYGASRRMNKKPFLTSRENDNLKWTSLFDETIELINVEEWFLEKFLKSKIAEDAIKQKVENQLELVKSILVEILPDINSIRIQPLESVNSKIIVEVETTFGWTNIKDLSYGYQTITALIVDIAANMMERYPESENPLSEPVIILIDEIDLHLHPKWQRTVLDKLSFHFPKAQFIVTAHSPLIVQAAQDRNANIVVCRKEGDRVVIDNNPESVKGWRIDQILTSDLFDVESSQSIEIEKLRNEKISLLLNKSLSIEDKERLKNIDQKLFSSPIFSSKESINAEALIKKAAELLKK